MKLNILIGGEAGQGINKISDIITETLAKQGYFTFSSRDYQSLIRGGHNFNVLTISDKWIASNESKLDGIVALDTKTLEIHKKELKEGGFILTPRGFENLGLNLNVALAGALIKILGMDKKSFLDEVEKGFIGALNIAEKGYKSQEKKFNLKKLSNKISVMTGTQAIAKGAINSSIDLYLGYPMTPATGVLHELAGKQESVMVFQPENEIAAVNSALGASFAGARVMVGTSGGGFDLMTEALSLQGQTEIPLVVYLASRPGPSTGIPTYTAQEDLDVALYGGHGEFPRIVIAPGDPIEAIELTNEAFYLAEKFNTLSIILTDKHLVESVFSLSKKANKILKIKMQRNIPGEAIIKANSYEHDDKGNTIENAELIIKGVERRIQKYKAIQREVNKFSMIKIYGKKTSKNLVLGWGSTKGAILDSIKDTDCKFIQVLYLKPLSDKIKKEIEKASKILLIEENATGQLGRLIREKTRIKIPAEDRILKYDGRPFLCDELKKEIGRRLR